MAYSLRTNKSWADTEADIREELRKWGAETYSLKQPNRKAAGTRAAANLYQTPEEALVVVQAHWKSGREFSLSYNKQSRAVDNARVLFLAIESLRKNELRGIDDVMREAYLQLPAPAEAVRERDPYEILGVRDDAELEDVEAVYRNKARRLHPDSANGDASAMLELNAAIEKIREARK